MIIATRERELYREKLGHRRMGRLICTPEKKCDFVLRLVEVNVIAAKCICEIKNNLKEKRSKIEATQCVYVFLCSEITATAQFSSTRMRGNKS